MAPGLVFCSSRPCFLSAFLCILVLAALMTEGVLKVCGLDVSSLLNTLIHRYMNIRLIPCKHTTNMFKSDVFKFHLCSTIIAMQFSLSDFAIVKQRSKERIDLNFQHISKTISQTQSVSILLQRQNAFKIITVFIFLLEKHS